MIGRLLLPVLGLALVAALAGPAAAQTREAPGLPQDAQLPIPVRLSVRILDVLAVRETAGQVVASLEMTQRWTDPGLAFDRMGVGREHLDSIGAEAEARLAEMWAPRVDIANRASAPRGETTALSIYHDGRVVLIRRLEADFRAPIDMSSFPFDRQRLPLAFVTPRHPASEVDLTTTELDRQYASIEPSPSAVNWRPRGLAFTSDSFFGWNAQPFARVVATMTLDRAWEHYILRLFVPFFAIMSVAPFVLWTPLSIMPHANRMPLVFSCLLALAALSFTFEASFPGSISMNSPVAFMTSVGYLYLPLVVLINVLLTTSADAAFLRRRPYLLIEVQRNVRVSLPVLFLALCLASLFAFGGG